MGNAGKPMLGSAIHEVVKGGHNVLAHLCMCVCVCVLNYIFLIYLLPHFVCIVNAF